MSCFTTVANASCIANKNANWSLDQKQRQKFEDGQIKIPLPNQIDQETPSKLHIMYGQLADSSISFPRPWPKPCPKAPTTSAKAGPPPDARTLAANSHPVAGQIRFQPQKGDRSHTLYWSASQSQWHRRPIQFLLWIALELSLDAACKGIITWSSPAVNSHVGKVLQVGASGIYHLTCHMVPIAAIISAINVYHINHSSQSLPLIIHC